jgi:hypothetical protein
LGLSYSTNSSSEVYLFIMGVRPINLPRKENVACIFHGNHQRSAPSHVAEGNHTIAVPETCLVRVSSWAYTLYFEEERTNCKSMIWKGLNETFFSYTSLAYSSKLVKKTLSIMSSALLRSAETSKTVSSGLPGTGLKL